MLQFTEITLILLIFTEVSRESGRRVVNNVNKDEVKPSALSSEADTMEDILNTDKFRDRKTFISEDPNIWAEALSEYDKLLRAQELLNNINQDWNDETSPHPHANSHWIDSPSVQINSVKRQVKTTDRGSLPEESGKLTNKSRSTGPLKKVIHSDKLVRSNEDSAAPVVVCKSKSSRSHSVGQGHQGSRNDREEAERGKLTVFDRTMKNSQMTQSIMYDNCGKPSPKGTVCFGLPSGCVEEQACRLIVNFGKDENNPGYISINLAGESSHSGFIAVAFSQDRFIGHDLVIYCINAADLPKHPVALYLAYTEGHHAVIQKSRKNFETNFCPRFGYQQSEMLACSFDIAAKVYLDNNAHANIKTTPFYLMLAFGHFIDTVPVNSSNYGGLKYQHLVQFSSDPIVLEKALEHPTIIHPRTRALVLLHAIPAVIAFLFLIPSGMFFAKYGRETNGYDKDVCKRFRLPAWLRNHIFLAVISVPFIITSLISILVELDFAWRSFRTMPMIHSIAGIIAYILITVNFACGFLYKCEQYSQYSSKNDVGENTGDERRAKWTLIQNWTHWGFGNVTYLCAIMCICVAGSLPRAQAPCFVEYFAYLHLGLFVCSHLIMTFDTKRLAKILGDDRALVNRRAIIGPMIAWRIQDMSNLGSIHDFCHMDIWKGRRRVILFFFLTSFICAFTISVLLLLPVVLCR